MKRNILKLLRLAGIAFRERKTVAILQEWYREESSLPIYYPVPDKILVIWLDDSANYSLWRNSLHIYKRSSLWANHQITLLGNDDWKDFFNYTDGECVDEVIWLNKNAYFTERNYRRELWERLRCEGFQTVICPSRIRMPLLDDSCAVATGSEQMFASTNNYFKFHSNKLSDAFYQYIYQPKYVKHDFLFNQDFANWCCHTGYTWQKPMIDGSLFRQPAESDYILCFISDSYKNNRLPTGTWMQLIKLMLDHYSSKIILAGESSDKTIANQIVKVLPVESIVGITSQTSLIDYLAFANAVITSDTVTAHLAVSCHTPTLILSNGENFLKLAAYQDKKAKNVEVVYATPFLLEQKRKNDEQLSDYVALAGDMNTMIACEILQKFENVYPSAIMRVISDN